MLHSLKTVEWKDNKVVMIDQTKLPNVLIFVEYDDYQDVANAIKTMLVRGAPAIGVSGAFGMALAVLHSNAQTKNDLIKELEEATKILIEICDSENIHLSIDHQRRFDPFFHQIKNIPILNKMGFKDITGVEINKKASDIAQTNNPDAKIINSSIEEFDNSNGYNVAFLLQK